ncbi:MAG: serine hydrolase domain-containing protein [Vicinamibacterales bacterium]
MRASRLLIFVLAATAALGQRSAAQPIAFPLFERYVESLRQQTGIPGLSAAIVQGGRIVWEAGLGSRDVEGALPATPDTPYPIGDLTQTLATVLLGECADSGRLDIDAPIGQWSTSIPEASATVRQVLAHASDSAARGGFRYDRGRFAALTLVAEACLGGEYRRLIADGVLDRLGMAESVPARDLEDAGEAARHRFDAADSARYAAVIRRMAVPYRVDRAGRATRSEYGARGLDAASGVISTVRDLARYDAALDAGDLLRPEVVGIAWQNALATNGTPLPTGLGWFVQTYNGQRLVWHFHMAPDAYSALILKVPGRDLTLILLANSDGLSASFSLADGDVTKSLFAKAFLGLFL